MSSIEIRARLAGWHRIASALTDAGGTIPAGITRVWDIQADLDKRKTELGDHRAAREPLVIKLLDGDTPTAAEWRHANELTLKLDILEDARDRIAHHILGAIDEHADTMLDTIRAGLFDPSVAALNDLASRVRPTETVEHLLRTGRDTDAHDLANAVIHADNISRARQARSYLTRQKDTYDTLWPDGAPVPAPKSVTEWLETLPERQPWLPSVAQVADAAAQRRADREAAAHEVIKSGNVTFF